MFDCLLLLGYTNPLPQAEYKFCSRLRLLNSPCPTAVAPECTTHSPLQFRCAWGLDNCLS